jgi:hypothetical protein
MEAFKFKSRRQKASPEEEIIDTRSNVIRRPSRPKIFSIPPEHEYVPYNTSKILQEL